MVVSSDVDNRKLFINHYDETLYPSYCVKVLILAVQIVFGVFNKMMTITKNINF